MCEKAQLIDEPLSIHVIAVAYSVHFLHVIICQVLRNYDHRERALLILHQAPEKHDIVLALNGEKLSNLNPAVVQAHLLADGPDKVRHRAEIILKYGVIVHILILYGKPEPVVLHRNLHLGLPDSFIIRLIGQHTENHVLAGVDHFNTDADQLFLVGLGCVRYI